MEEIRVGLIGFGFVSQTFHVPLLRGTDGFRIAAVASSRPDDVKALLPEVDVVREPRAMATHPDVDLVVIATPNETHAPLAEAVLRAGRHAVVEKPFTVTVAEARHLTGVARECGTMLSVFHNRRWDSDFLTVQRTLNDEVLGNIALFESRLDRFRPHVRDRWREKPGPGSGLLYDLGPHLIDQALLLFGIPDDVQTTLARQRSGAETDDYFHLVLRRGEQVVVLQAGSLVSGGSTRFAVHGDRGSLVKHLPDVQEDQLKAGVMPGDSGWGVDPDDAVLYDGVTGETHSVKTTPGDQRGFYRALREALRGAGANPVPPTQGATIIAIIEAALRSDAEGRRVVPDLTDDERGEWK